MIALGLEMSAKILNTHFQMSIFNAGRLLFEFNGLQYILAAREVFMAFVNFASLAFG